MAAVRKIIKKNTPNKGDFVFLTDEIKKLNNYVSELKESVEKLKERKL